MKIEISVVRNGLLVTIDVAPTASDPMAQRSAGGTWFARDTTDALGRIAQVVKGEFDLIVDRLAQD